VDECKPLVIGRKPKESRQNRVPRTPREPIIKSNSSNRDSRARGGNAKKNPPAAAATARKMNPRCGVQLAKPKARRSARSATRPSPPRKLPLLSAAEEVEYSLAIQAGLPWVFLFTNIHVAPRH
jgi:hypothetical protein